MLAEKKLDVSNAKKLAVFIVEVYASIQQKFSVDDFRHYAFTPKSIYKIFIELMRYDCPNFEAYVEALVNELSRNYRDRLVGN
jgi:beta-lactamase class D